MHTTVSNTRQKPRFGGILQPVFFGTSQKISRNGEITGNFPKRRAEISLPRQLQSGKNGAICAPQFTLSAKRFYVHEQNSYVRRRNAGYSARLPYRRRGKLFKFLARLNTQAFRPRIVHSVGNAYILPAAHFLYLAQIPFKIPLVCHSVKHFGARLRRKRS